MHLVILAGKIVIEGTTIQSCQGYDHMAQGRAILRHPTMAGSQARRCCSFMSVSTLLYGCITVLYHGNMLFRAAVCMQHYANTSGLKARAGRAGG